MTICCRLLVDTVEKLCDGPGHPGDRQGGEGAPSHQSHEDPQGFQGHHPLIIAN